MEEHVHIEVFSFSDECAIETLVFGEAARQARKAAMQPAVELCCRDCGSDLVAPLQWEQMDEETWSILLGCPECETVYELVLGRSTMERYIAQLHAQKRALIADLRHWDKARFREDVERLLALIDADLVVADDF